MLFTSYITHTYCIALVPPLHTAHMRFMTQWGCNSSLLDMPLPHTLNPTSLGGGEHTHDQPPPHLPLLLSDSLSLDFP